MLPLTLLFAGPALELEPLSVPTAHHGEKMRIERFRVPAAGIEETSPRVIKKCVDGADVSDRLPLTLAVVELRVDSLWFAGEELGPSKGGVPGKAAQERLQVELSSTVEATRWLARRGCRPWDGQRPWFLLAVDARVPMGAVNQTMALVHEAGVRNIALLVDDGSPSPEFPPESLPEKPAELLLVEREAEWTVLQGEERRKGSLDDVQVWLRTGEVEADRVTVVMDPLSTVQDLVYTHDAMVGAGVLSVVPAQVDEGLPVVAALAEAQRAPVRWTVAEDGLVPVHLIRLPEQGVTVPAPRVGPELKVTGVEAVGGLSSLPIEAVLQKAAVEALLCSPDAAALSVTVEFTIEADGRATSFRAEASPVTDCLKGAIEQERFSTSESTTLVTVGFEYVP